MHAPVGLITNRGSRPRSRPTPDPRALRVGLLLTAGCAYHPGSFSDGRPFRGTPITLGCIDLAVERRASATDPVIAYQFGNRCDHRVTLDLAAVQVVSREADGASVTLLAHDPDHEIRPLPLPARFSGSERIAYRTPDNRPIGTVCVDVGGITGSTAHSQYWVCP